MTADGKGGVTPHTTEPWKAVDGEVRMDGYSGLLVIARTDPSSFTRDARTANAARIVATVNACAGMTDPAAEIAALRRVQGRGWGGAPVPRMVPPRPWLHRRHRLLPRVPRAPVLCGGDPRRARRPPPGLCPRRCAFTCAGDDAMTDPERIAALEAQVAA